MRKNTRISGSGIIRVLLFLAALPFAASAGEPAPADRWTFAVQPYLWLPNLNGSLNYTVPSAGGGSANVDITNNSILEDLNFALMLTAEARKGRWALVTDFIYLDIGGQDSQVKSVNFP